MQLRCKPCDSVRLLWQFSSLLSSHNLKFCFDIFLQRAENWPYICCTLSDVYSGATCLHLRRALGVKVEAGRAALLCGREIRQAALDMSSLTRDKPLIVRHPQIKPKTVEMTFSYTDRLFQNWFHNLTIPNPCLCTAALEETTTNFSRTLLMNNVEIILPNSMFHEWR